MEHAMAEEGGLAEELAALRDEAATVRRLLEDPLALARRVVHLLEQSPPDKPDPSESRD